MAALIYAHPERCVDCRACEVACQRVHDGLTNVTVARVEDRFAVPLMWAIHDEIERRGLQWAK